VAAVAAGLAGMHVPADFERFTAIVGRLLPAGRVRIYNDGEVALAAATIWLFLTNPVTVATAVNEGDVTPLVRQLAQVLYQALSGLLKYL